MINKLSKFFTNKLFVNGVISEDEQELYIYGLFMLISQLMYLTLACLLGLILGCFVESIIFYIAFQIIRRYAGGYHATTEARCEILSTLSILACIILIKLSKVYDIQTVFLIISVISSVCIFFLCPLDTPEKPLSDKEAKYFRKISWIVLFVIDMVIILFDSFNLQFIFIPCCISLIFESILLILGKLKKCLVIRNQ